MSFFTTRLGHLYLDANSKAVKALPSSVGTVLQAFAALAA